MHSFIRPNYERPTHTHTFRLFRPKHARARDSCTRRAYLDRTGLPAIFSDWGRPTFLPLHASPLLLCIPNYGAEFRDNRGFSLISSLNRVISGNRVVHFSPPRENLSLRSALSASAFQFIFLQLFHFFHRFSVASSLSTDARHWYWFNRRSFDDILVGSH